MAKLQFSAIQRTTQLLQLVVLSVAALYFGGPVLMPLAMAVLLSFLLTPFVVMLERRGMRRIPAVLLVMAIIFSSIGVGGFLIGSQFYSLGQNFPKYKVILVEKARSLSIVGRAFESFRETAKEIEATTEQNAEKVQPVRIVEPENVPVANLQVVLAAVATPLANAGVVVILVVFLLIGREDMRNRLVRLAGKRLALTTRALDDVGSRVSRYLLMNFYVNGGFGTCVAVGLWLIGVEYALMWGVLAGTLRFIPYVGPIVAMVMPVGMAIAQFDGWTESFMVVGLFIVLELITNNVIEPLAYGHSTGVSTVALITAAVFWTWVWGPMGLILSVPLTVLLAVLGEHIKPLEPLAVLLGDKPALDLHLNYYQRLLAGDVEEAGNILEEQHRKGSLIEAYDAIVIRALVLAEYDIEHGELTAEDQQTIWQTNRELIDDLPASKTETVETTKEPAVAVPKLGLSAYVIGCPAHDTSDELALLMLGQTLNVVGGTFETLASNMLVSEMVQHVEKQQPDAVCVSSLGPVGIGQTRHLCKRLRQSFPHLRIIVGRWGYHGDREKMTAGLKQRGADQVATSLAEASDMLIRVTPLKQGTATARAAG